MKIQRNSIKTNQNPFNLIQIYYFFVKTCQNVSEPIKTCPDTSKPTQIHPKLVQPVKTCPNNYPNPPHLSNPSRLVQTITQTRQNLSKLIQTRQNSSKTCPNLSQPVKTCPTPAQTCPTCPTCPKLVQLVPQTCPNLSAMRQNPSQLAHIYCKRCYYCCKRPECVLACIFACIFACIRSYAILAMIHSSVLLSHRWYWPICNTMFTLGHYRTLTIHCRFRVPCTLHVLYVQYILHILYIHVDACM